MFKRLIAMLVMICFTGTTQAVMIATPTDRSQLLGVLDRVEVQNQLQAHGVSIEQAKARMCQYHWMQTSWYRKKVARSSLP
jgi:hypothetical protein